MASLAVFLCPEQVGIARVKAPGFNPSFSSPQWRILDNVQQLLDEPVMLASLIREMIGDEEKYDVYLNVWPGVYNAVMFSHDKKGKADVSRLRQSELETVFRGEYNKLYTHDLMLNQGKPFADDKIRRVIFAFPKERVHLLNESFAAQKMNLQRIAPMDVAVAEAALQFWAPKDQSISVCMMLDESCTSVSFMRGGVIHALRTLPNGFNTVLADYMHVTSQDHDTSLNMLRENGVHVSDEKLTSPSIQDDIIRTLNRLVGETVKTLHNTFGNDAVIDQVLLCGNFVPTVGLVDYLNTMLDTQCIVAGADTLNSNARSAIVLDEADLVQMFPLAATTAKGADLMSELKKNHSDKVRSVVICSAMAAAFLLLVIITPLQKGLLQRQKNSAEEKLNQPEYAAVQELYNTRDELNRQKNNLSSAIEALPHGVTNTGDIISTLTELTAKYGTLLSISTDYSAGTIQLSFSTFNYDSFVYWQKAVVENDRFTFTEPPAFSGNGLLYTVNASLTAVDFEDTTEADSEEQTAETSAEETIAETSAEGNG